MKTNVKTRLLGLLVLSALALAVVLETWTSVQAQSLLNSESVSGAVVVAWGYNGDGQTNVPTGLSNVVAIAAGDAHTVTLKQDGTVVAWGSSSAGQSTVPAGLSNVVAIAAGRNHTVALKQDGTVVAWGFNDYGQSTVPAGLSNVVAIAAGYAHTAVLEYYRR